jgi:xylulokinase
VAQAPVIFCADIGTSSLKAALIDVEGRMKAFARKAYPHEKVRAEDWEAALISATEQLLATGIKPAAVCISGNGPTLVPYTRKGTALYPLHWYDLPKENGDDEALARFASSAKAKSLFLPHVKSFSQVQPSAYEETLHFFSPQEWLSFCLGADPVAVLSSPALLPYYWEEDQCAALELDLGKFPPFAELGSVIGKVSRSASERFKLPAGIPVAAGGPDFLMALLGVGAIEPGLVCDRAGTSEGINVCSAFPIQSKVLRVLPHLQEGLWNIGGVFASSGKLFEWYRTLTGQGERAYEDILSELINPDGSLPCARAKQSAKTFFFPQFGILS